MIATATTAPAAFTAAALWLEDGDEIRPFGTLVRVRGVFADAPGWVRIVVQHVEGVTGDPLRDVYSFATEATRVYEVTT